jgi:hypothetical protein
MTYPACAQRSRILAVASLALLNLPLQASSAFAQPATLQPASSISRHPVLSALEVGRSVTLVSTGPAWDISLLNEGAIGSHRVVELGPDHVLLQDFVGLARIWIPVSAIRSVQWVRTDAPRSGAILPNSPNPFTPSR